MTLQPEQCNRAAAPLTEGDVVAIVEKYGREQDQLLAMLLDIQEASGSSCVLREWAAIVARELGVPLSKVFEVLTFYSMFSTEPRGRHLVEICKSTPCKMCKSDEVVAMFEKELGVKLGKTTADKRFTLMHTSCVGACDIGPVAKIGEEIYGTLTPEKVSEIVSRYREKN